MLRLSKIDLFKQAVRDALLEHLPEGFLPDPNRPFRIVRTTDWGEQYLWVSPSTRGWPDAVAMVLSFGVIFRVFAEIDRAAGTAPPPQRGDRAFSMDSSNMRQMQGLPYPKSFPLNLKVFDDTTDEGRWYCKPSDPPSKIAQRMIGFLGGVVFPFFERFSTLHTVRESLVLDDGWLMSGIDGRHEDVLLIDIALNDKAHFHDYISANKENKNFPSVLKKVPMLIERFPHFAFESPTVEPCAPPTGSPTTQLGNSVVTEEPLSGS